MTFRKAYRIIPFYLLSEALPPIAVTFAVLSFLVFCQQLSRNSELFLSPLINWKVTLQILGSLLPPIFTFTLPVAIVIGEIVTLTRLAADHEWVALAANTLGRWTRLGPFLLIGTLGAAAVLALNWNFAPQAIARIKEARNSLALNKAATQIQPQTFISEFPDHLLKINSVDRQTGKWEGVILLRKEPGSSKIQLLAAKSGGLAPLDEALNAFEIKLTNGVFIDNLLSANDHVTSAFKENTIKITPNKRSPDVSLEAASPVQLAAMGELLARLKKAQAAGVLSANEVEIEIFKRFTNALACMYAACCALVLTSRLHRRTARRSLLVLASFLLLVIYFASLTYGQNLALKGKLTGQQGSVLGCLLPCLVLVLVHLALSRDFFSFPRFTSKRENREITPEADTRILQTTFQPQLPTVNLGHYLVISEFAKFFLLTLTILTGTILLFTLLDVAPSVARNNIKLDFVLGYLARYAPQIIYYVAPFGILVAIVAAATALARTGQLTILLYYATNPLRLALPVILGTLVIYLSIVSLSDSVLPFSNREQDNRYRKIKGKSTEDVTVAFDRQWVSDEDTNTIYGYRLMETDGRSTLNALVFKLTNPNYFLSEILYFDQVDFQTTGIGFRYHIGQEGLAKLENVGLSELPPNLKSRDTLYEKTYHEASKMTFKQLQSYIAQVERTGLSTTGLRMEQAQKRAFPFACVTLLFLAFPVCLLLIRRQHQSRFSAAAISIALALVFWGILSLFEAAGKHGTLPISIAAWSPHALFLALASTIQIKIHHS